MNCSKIKQRCSGVKQYAACVEYQLELPLFSTIEDECVSIEDTTEDTYNLISELRDETDLSELGQNCLSYVQVNGKNVVKEVLLKYEEEICNLKTEVEALKNGSHICNQSIEGCNLDFGELLDQCNQPITTVGEALQEMLNQINQNSI